MNSHVVKYDAWDPITDGKKYIISPNMECRFGIEEGVCDPVIHVKEEEEYRDHYYSEEDGDENQNENQRSLIDLDDVFDEDMPNIIPESVQAPKTEAAKTEARIPIVKASDAYKVSYRGVTDHICSNYYCEFPVQHYVRFYFDTSNEKCNSFLAKCLQYGEIHDFSFVRYSKTKGKLEPYIIANVRPDHQKSSSDSNSYSYDSTELYDEKKVRLPTSSQNLCGTLVTRVLLKFTSPFSTRACQMLKYYPKMKTNVREELISKVNHLKYRPYSIGYIEAMQEFELLKF